MSEQAMADFRSLLAGDESLQQELRDATGIGSSDALPITGLIEFAASKGFEVTLDDVGSSDLGLSDAELDTVAGGAAYVKFGGIDGETLDKDHKSWSDLASFNQVISGFRR